MFYHACLIVGFMFTAKWTDDGSGWGANLGNSCKSEAEDGKCREASARKRTRRDTGQCLAFRCT